ncbi:BlaI/MecI/CopY family transcriptional regulator [Protofrankia symbiont of Coriaria ruscifolia]|uniref:Penicillinase repressor n=1 Tax=Candidatus Protofrankia californiensis TaxID=1839754 RepID=A0A1C3PDP3_9ACTN|nr:BlaI/MecI/CopY family transcriptional regulator [Protofrankia symbiont of Coriaria ruscifolia]SBW27949.1 penicillinase repressor [Candidatus Protofrankia californiensis]
MARRPRREPGALEREVLAAIAAAGRPLTPAETLAELAELGEPLAYTTVMTTLARLHAKGALTRAPAGRSYAYAPATAPDSLDAALTARQMTRLLGAGAHRAETLARFVADLRPEDEQLLIDILATHQPDADNTDGRTRR